MAYCRLEFVDFLPEPWRNLDTLDKQIISHWTNDYSSLLYFIEYLEGKRNMTGWDRYLPSDPLNPPLNPSFREKCYVDEHATLCHAAISMLKDSDKEKYNDLINLIKKSQFNSGSYPFFSGYDWLGLPELWRGPHHQENLMIQYLEKDENHKDVLIYLQALKNNSYDGSYPKLSLLVSVISYMKGWCDVELLRKIQRLASLVDGDEYNSIMIRHGCLEGRRAIRGWGCENDPTIAVKYTNLKIQDLKGMMTDQREYKLKEQYDILAMLARPWRLTPDTWSLGTTIKKDTDEADRWNWMYYCINVGEERLSVKFIDNLNLLINDNDFTAALLDVDKSRIKIGCNERTAIKLASMLKDFTEFQKI